LKLLTGLYRPQQGEILLDGRPVTDFHLFERLYGAPDADPAVVNKGLEDLGLADKTEYTPEGFTDLALSTGQRKRLAFLAAVLRDRPICVFDELAADQDPGFRRRFYEEILPELSRQGRTLVVVSHDERYFHTADRVLRVGDGLVSE
jgi:putative ATP-binding cassette transporter